MYEGRRYWNVLKVHGCGIVWTTNREFIKCLARKLDNAGIPSSCVLDIHIEMHLEDNPYWTYYKPLGSSFGCFLCFKHIPASFRDKIVVRLLTTFKEFYGKS